MRHVYVLAFYLASYRRRHEVGSIAALLVIFITVVQVNPAYISLSKLANLFISSPIDFFFEICKIKSAAD